MKKRSDTLNHMIIYKPFNYNGIQVHVGHRKKVMIKPKGSLTWFTYNRDELIEKVKNMPSTESIQGVPKNKMLEFLNFDFEKSFWGRG